MEGKSPAGSLAQMPERCPCYALPLAKLAKMDSCLRCRHENCKKLERCHFLLGRKHTFLIRALRINTKPSFSLCTNILKTGDYVNYYKRTGGFVYTFPLNVTVFRQTSHAFWLSILFHHSDKYFSQKSFAVTI